MKSTKSVVFVFVYENVELVIFISEDWWLILLLIAAVNECLKICIPRAVELCGRLNGGDGHQVVVVGFGVDAGDHVLDDAGVFVVGEFLNKVWATKWSLNG